jgi:hypothetical protein
VAASNSTVGFSSRNSDLVLATARGPVVVEYSVRNVTYEIVAHIAHGQPTDTLQTIQENPIRAHARELAIDVPDVDVAQLQYGIGWRKLEQPAALTNATSHWIWE